MEKRFLGYDHRCGLKKGTLYRQEKDALFWSKVADLVEPNIPSDFRWPSIGQSRILLTYFDDR